MPSAIFTPAVVKANRRHSQDRDRRTAHHGWFASHKDGSSIPTKGTLAAPFLELVHMLPNVRRIDPKPEPIQFHNGRKWDVYRAMYAVVRKGVSGSADRIADVEVLTDLELVRESARWKRTPANPNLVNMQQAMLIALGWEGPMGNDASDLRLAVMHQLKKQDVLMIVFDEFTHIVEDRSEKFATKTMRGLKEILNASTYRIVLAGTEELVSVYKLYDQMKRRSVGDRPIHAFNWEDEDDREEWLEMMDLIQERMYLKVEPELGSDDVSRKMHQATGGTMDHIMKILFRATSFAYRDKASVIGMGHLSMAFERLRRGDDKSVNPFGKPPVRRRKPKVIEDTEDEDEVTNLSKRKDKRDDGFEKS